MAAKRLGTLHGVALRPGVSRNNRLYTRENIAAAAQSATARLEDGSEPMTMRLLHPLPGEDSTVANIAARVTSWRQDPASGDLLYTADVADTPAGRIIINLLPEDPNETAFLHGVSIRGAWGEEARIVAHPDDPAQQVVTADSLVLDGLDFTDNPGVRGAHAVLGNPAPTANAGVVPPVPAIPGGESAAALSLAISESAPASVVRATRTPYGEDVTYADNGYLPDGAKRLPLSTTEQMMDAWRQLATGRAATVYSPAQLKRIRERTAKAVLAKGARVTAEGNLVTAPQALTEDFWGSTDGPTPAGYCLHVTNGPTTVSISTGLVDPRDLPEVGLAAMAAAISAIVAIDPDLDADVDTGADDTDDANVAIEIDAPEISGESAGTGQGQALAEHRPAQPDPTKEDALSTEATAGAAEPADTATEPAPQQPAPMIALTQDQFALLMASFQSQPATAPAEAAPAAPVAEAAPAVPEPQDQVPTAPAAPTANESAAVIDKLIADRVTATIQAMVATGDISPQRRGLINQAAESAPGAQGGGPAQRQLTEMSPQELAAMPTNEFFAQAGPHLLEYVTRGRRRA
jgi:hypothetical protein